jgi:hypothetical protein
VTAETMTIAIRMNHSTPIVLLVRGWIQRDALIPARCRSCGFTFDERKLSKPGKCPSCRGTRLYEPQVLIAASAEA